MISLIVNHQVSVWNSAPASMRLLMDHITADPSAVASLPLKTVLLSGDWIPLDLPDEIRDHASLAQIISLGGATEASIWSIGLKVDRVDPAWKRIPYGKPLSGQGFFVLHKDLRPCPDWVAGELMIDGPGLALGYWREPSLTAERFIPHPAPVRSSPDRRLYRTGDLGRRLPDGTIEILGRIDRCLKIRGFRIEPGEIESHLQNHPAVRAARVVARGENDKEHRLEGYLTIREGVAEPSVQELQAFLAERLPAYMRPHALRLIDRFPLTSNGKVDVKALLDLGRVQPIAAPETATETELQIIEIWREVLAETAIRPETDFFAAGGNSLSAHQAMIRIRKRFGADLPLSRLFEHPSPRSFGRVLDGMGSVTPKTLTKPPGRSSAVTTDKAPLSIFQERLWFLEQLEPGTAKFNMPIALQISGELHFFALREAFRRVIARQAVLRTRFRQERGEDRPVQIVTTEIEPALIWVDLSGLNQDSTLLNGLANDAAHLTFSLESGPLLRVHLFRQSENRHLMVLNLHHIVCDGWSLKILLRELAFFYAASLGRDEGVLAPLPLGYTDFSRAQHERTTVEARNLRYWASHLADLPERSEFIADRSRPAIQTFNGRLFAFHLNSDETHRLDQWRRTQKTSSAVCLFTTFAVLLARYAGRTDLCIGTTVANRNDPDHEPLIGFFANTLPLRIRLDPSIEFEALARQVHSVLMDGLNHQDTPFDRLVERIQPKRDPGRSPLFQVLFTVENLGLNRLAGLEFPGLSLDWRPLELRVSKYDFSMHLNETESGLAGLVEYNSDLFDEATIARISNHYRNLLHAFTSGSRESVFRAPILSAKQRERVLAFCGQDASDEPRQASLIQLFEKQVEVRPDSVALVHDQTTRTYACLKRMVKSLFIRLRRLGARPEMRIGLCADTGPETIAAMLAVLEIGGVYAPLAPDLPPERMAWLIRDLDVSILLTAGSQKAALPAFETGFIPILDLEETRPSFEKGESQTWAGPDSLAYIMYTSGATGFPKGVGVTHRGIVRLIASQRSALTPDDVVLQASPLSFDASTYEIWGALTSGSRLALAPSNAMAQLPWLIKSRRVSALWLTAQFFQLMMDDHPDALAGLRLLLAGGESLSAKHVRAFLQQCPNSRILNGYGPTEATTFTCLHDPRDRMLDRAAPIGRPLRDTSVFVLDRYLEPVPPGVIGELWIAGSGLARGYWRNPVLTAERFIPHPLAKASEAGARLYRSGDRARMLDDGVFVFVGRIDRQVKVRGFRIELEEVEFHLKKHAEIKDAIVRPWGKGLARVLAAWLRMKRASAPFDRDRFRAFLAARLPDYMIPTLFHELDAFPVNDRGKIDYDRLPAPRPQTQTLTESHSLPTPTMRIIARIWADLLNRSEPAPDDDFFELGGHSLLAMRVMTRLADLFRIEPRLTLIFKHPKLDDLARAIDLIRAETSGFQQPDLTPAPRELNEAGQAILPLSFAQERLWFLDRLEPGSAGYNMPVLLEADGALRADLIGPCFEMIARRHESLRTRFSAIDGDPIQIIEAEPALELVIHDLSGLEEATRQRVWREQSQREIHRPFALDHGPLLRVTLFRLGARSHLMLVNMHHIVSDGWSLKIMFHELARFYAAFLEGVPLSSSPPRVQYGDYAYHQRQWFAERQIETPLNYWVEKLADAPHLLAIPTDFVRKDSGPQRGDHLFFSVDASLTASFQQLCGSHGATLFMGLAAVYALLLARFCCQDEICIGTPVAGRRRIELEPLIGLFVNTLVIHADLRRGSEDLDFAGLLARVRDTSLEAYLYQDAPFEKVVDRLQPARETNRTPVIQTMLSLVNLDLDLDRIELGGARLRALDFEYRIAKFDLSLDVTEKDGGLNVALAYAADLFLPSTIQCLAQCFTTLLRSVTATPHCPVHRIPIHDEAEWRGYLAQLSGEARSSQSFVPLSQEFDARATRQPDAACLIGQGKTISYQTLSQAVSRIAHRLRDIGVTPDQPVVVVLEDSLERHAIMLGVLKAGGVYWPLRSAELSRARAALADGGVSLIAAREPEVCLGLDIQRIWVEDLFVESDSDQYGSGPETHPGQIALIQTRSKPDGSVIHEMITHKALSQYCRSLCEQHGLGVGDRVLHSGSLGSVISPEWALPFMISGSALVMATGARRFEPKRLDRDLKETGITALCLTAADWRTWLRAKRQAPTRKGLRLVIVVGEHLNRSTWRTWSKLVEPGAILQHLYGGRHPAWTVLTPRRSSRADEAEPLSTTPTLIAQPRTSARLLILDAFLQPTPVGWPGRVYLGDDLLARGYWRRPALTAEYFVPDPLIDEAQPSTGARLLKTSDWARRRADGGLEYLNRTENEVAGNRFEPERVSDALREYAGVQDAYVARFSDGKDLVAWLVSARRISERELRRYLRARLPEFMVPGRFAFVDRLPRTPTGGIDGKALPDPAPREDGLADAAPRTTTQKTVAELWRTLLANPAIGIHDNFFDLGGHSLLAIRLIDRIEQALSVRLPVKTFFEYPTVESLADYIDFIIESMTPLTQGSDPDATRFVMQGEVL